MDILLIYNLIHNNKNKMPYEVIKNIKPSGYYVVKKGTNMTFSSKPFKTKAEAIKQMQAIILSEQRRKYK